MDATFEHEGRVRERDLAPYGFNDPVYTLARALHLNIWMQCAKKGLHRMEGVTAAVL